MNILLFDGPERESLLPFTFTKPVCEIQTGIYNNRQRWEKISGNKVSVLTADYLKEKYKVAISAENILVNGAIRISKSIVDKIQTLKPGEGLISENGIIAACINEKALKSLTYPFQFENLKIKVIKIEVKLLRFPWEIFLNAEEEISNDIELTKLSSSPSSRFPEARIKGEDLFAEEGVKIFDASINTENGPVYLGKNSMIMEGCMVRGPLVLGENSILKMGAKIYGATVIGKNCKIGGEVSNSVIMNYSNKAHDGYLGNSVVGEWCNLGADTNTSNLKNNYSEVQVFSYKENGYISTGQQFCGVLMGDHCKTSINTMLNTGTVVGPHSNIFCSGFPSKHIPPFSWVSKPDSFEKHLPEKAVETARRMFERRSLKFSEQEREIIYSISENWK